MLVLIIIYSPRWVKNRQKAIKSCYSIRYIKKEVSLLDTTSNFEGNYAGKSFINPQATTDSLSLSLGVDPNIIVSRKKLENFKSKSFLGGTRIIDKGYSIEVKNNKKNSINLILEDRIPISQNKEIKVSDLKTGDALYKSKTGILRWELSLSPNEISKKEFSYTVKHPKYKRINL